MCEDIDMKRLFSRDSWITRHILDEFSPQSGWADQKDLGL